MMTNRWLIPISLLCMVTFTGCKPDPEPEEPEQAAKGDSCDPTAEDGADSCAEGLTCAQVAGTQDSVCGYPLELRGYVIDALDESPIEGAEVIALDNSSAPVSELAVTDADGRYVMEVPAARDENGDLAPDVIYTLNVSAAGYVTYPGGVRPAFPVDASAPTSEPVEGEEGLEISVVENASTTVALVPTEGAAGITIRGTIDDPNGGGALVIAEGLGTPTVYGLSDIAGAFTLFNVPPGNGTLRAYRGGLSVAPEDVTVEDVDLEVTLSAGDGSLARVDGSVNIVNAPGGSMTSVVLIPSAVFSETLERGPVPFALRAPEPGQDPSITGAFEIPNVPPGTYKVLAAFENDGLVRDPDTGIAGTEIVEITVSGADITLPTSFKITAALAVESPGANGPEEVSGTPVFQFEDDSSEDRYSVVVYNALGEIVWQDDMVPSGNGGAPVSVTYAGEVLVPGMYYQFRATSIRDSGVGATPISRTEDLRGLFVFAP